jgi:RNA polymerase sigma-70 factor (ECF subfamily)
MPAQALEELVREHQGALRGYLAFLGCPRAQVDDLVQDVFLSVLAAGFEDRGPASTAAYLRVVARHLYLKVLRRERRAPSLEELEAAEHAWARYERDDGGEGYQDALRACLERIEGRAREVLRLRYEGGLAQAEIGERVGLAESGVHAILVRAKKRLRACIERRLAS